MDLPWTTAAWDCTGQQTKPPFFHYHADSAAHVVQISRRAGDGAARFNEEKHAQVLRTEREWNDWLDEVFGIPSASQNYVDVIIGLLLTPMRCRNPTPHP
jgi:hypothetical protein